MSSGDERVPRLEALKFRLTAFGLHFSGSCTTLTLILGVLYFGWYRWPGWYVTGAARVVLVMIAVDVVLGPLITLIVADARKSRAMLARDIGIIVTIQLAALIYGGATLWSGRPLYYALSADCLQVVQAYNLDADALLSARKQHAALLPHWYSLPRWIWAPLPQDPEEAQRILQSALHGGVDVIGMPQYFKPWNEGLPELRAQLKSVKEIRYFSVSDKQVLEQRMRASGLATDERNAIALTGRGGSLLAVIDPSSFKIKAFIRAS